MVDKLVTPKDHKDFWKELRRLDQTFRGANTDLESDDRYLLLDCMYYNKFGYTDPLFAGKESSIIDMIWAHNTVLAFDSIMFPVIMSGFKLGSCIEIDYREYYLRISYHNFYKDTLHKTLPIDSVYKRINAHYSDCISMKDIVVEKLKIS